MILYNWIPVCSSFIIWKFSGLFDKVLMNSIKIKLIGGQWFEQYLADFSYLPIKLQLSLKKKKNQTPIIVSPFFSVKVKKKMVKFGWLSVSIGKTYEKFNSIFNKLIQKYNMFNQTSKVSPCSPKNILTRTY